MIMKYARCMIPVGYKHDKGVLLYPTKKDIRKISWVYPGLCWLRIFYFLTREQPHTKSRHLRLVRPVNHMPTLLVGNSMVRFMTNLHEGTHVVSVGGAKLLDSLECLKSQLHLWDVFVVVFHSGTNNVNKTYYPEDSQISMASQSLVQIER